MIKKENIYKLNTQKTKKDVMNKHKQWGMWMAWAFAGIAALATELHYSTERVLSREEGKGKVDVLVQLVRENSDSVQNHYSIDRILIGKTYLKEIDNDGKTKISFTEWYNNWPKSLEVYSADDCGISIPFFGRYGIEKSRDIFDEGCNGFEEKEDAFSDFYRSLAGIRSIRLAGGGQEGESYGLWTEEEMRILESKYFLLVRDLEKTIRKQITEGK